MRTLAPQAVCSMCDAQRHAAVGRAAEGACTVECSKSTSQRPRQFDKGQRGMARLAERCDNESNKGEQGIVQAPNMRRLRCQMRS
mmetsp:Transcript_19321/g.33216  ORF Transcript_19321/g.33216 Transcript_19321/m.33216 type:complete len:85 (+) Transcript_19321:455-709(+)